MKQKKNKNKTVYHIHFITQIFISSNVHCSSLTCTYLNIMTLNGTKLICCYTTYPD
ncbi:hypothetical protein DERF_001792 [Dermatophagoides farinae]|uniref:Uncharacterized protein n=1 Tax=Dermatophagoides farinae TaxID=6954 RepID=A0A922IB55_DERFA|nr:hypothetical protein DERF_001792 [Dermatophagoides farinae]